ncbi:MAG TPA: hypothetical protein VKA15_24235, partial [Isosphaeraceae bacterium]|nr:hypothetical protein [Isosphaeraceae bacterium]
MTFVGRILVIVIMLFSLIFLGISTVVYSTSKNWKTATQEQMKKVEELKKKLTDAQAQKDAAAKGQEEANNKFEALAKNLTNQI